MHLDDFVEKYLRSGKFWMILLLIYLLLYFFAYLVFDYESFGGIDVLVIPLFMAVGYLISLVTTPLMFFMVFISPNEFITEFGFESYWSVFLFFLTIVSIYFVVKLDKIDKKKLVTLSIIIVLLALLALVSCSLYVPEISEGW